LISIALLYAAWPLIQWLVTVNWLSTFASYAVKYAWLVPMNAGNISTDIAKGAPMPVAHVPENVAQ
jgi:hypothetical protein